MITSEREERVGLNKGGGSCCSFRLIVSRLVVLGWMGEDEGGRGDRMEGGGVRDEMRGGGSDMK